MKPAYTMEPELLRPIPRRVRRRKGKSGGCKMGCGALFLLPHTAVGVGMFIVAFYLTFVAILGTAVPAHITGRETSRDSDGDAVYRLQYRYPWNGATYDKEASVSRETFEGSPDGAPVTVRVFPQLPNYPILDVPGNRTTPVWFFWLFALFWNSIVAVFWWGMLVTPRVQKRLVRRGTPVVGRVLHKRLMKGSYGDTHYVRYEFFPDANAEAIAQAPVNREGVPVLPQTPFSGFSTGTEAVQQSPFASGRASAANAVEAASPDSALSDESKPGGAVEAGPSGSHSGQTGIPGLTSDSESTKIDIKDGSLGGIMNAVGQIYQQAKEEKERIEALTTPGATVREIIVQSDQWLSVQEGDTVTVLYDPRKPKRNMLYRFGDYEAVA